MEGTISRAGLLFFIEHFTESFCYYLSIVYPFLLMILLVVYMLWRSSEEITPLYPSKIPLFPTEDYSLLIIYFIHLPCVLPISPSANFVITAASNLWEGFLLCRRLHKAALQPQINLIPLHQPCDIPTPTLSAFSPIFKGFSKADPKSKAAVCPCISEFQGADHSA